MSDELIDVSRLPDRARLEAARRVVYRKLPATAQHRWPLLERRTGSALWVKHENHSLTGAFKVRGGLVYLDWLANRPDRPTAVISATRGNHGQSIAVAARAAGIAAHIVVPYGNSREKNAAMRAFGAELIEHGEDFQAASEHAQRLASTQGLHRVPSFHPLLVAGVASYWLEFFEAAPDMDRVYVPIGMGSGAAAAIAARDALGLRTEVVGVVAERAPAFADSIEQGEIVERPVTTRIADGLACRAADPSAFAILSASLHEVVRVSDDAIEDAMKALFVDTHNLAEGAGAAGLAAAIARPAPGRRIGIVITGANVDHDVFARVLARPD